VAAANRQHYPVSDEQMLNVALGEERVALDASSGWVSRRLAGRRKTRLF
jgi:hypothetical protein